MEYVEKIIDDKIQGKALVTENKKQNSKNRQERTSSNSIETDFRSLMYRSIASLLSALSIWSALNSLSSISLASICTSLATSLSKFTSRTMKSEYLCLITPLKPFYIANEEKSKGARVGKKIYCKCNAHRWFG